MPLIKSKKIGIISVAITLASLALSAGLLAYCFRNVNWRQLIDIIMHQLSISLIAILIAINFGIVFLKAARFRFIINRPDISFLQTNSALLVGFFANNILPARVGEIARAIWINRFKKTGLAAVVANVGVDHILEGAGLILLIVFLLSNPQQAGAMTSRLLWVTGICFAAAALLVTAGYLFRPTSLEAPNGQVSGWKLQVSNFMRFVALSPKRAFLMILYSGFIWYVQVIFLALVQAGFGLEWNVPLAALALLAINLAIAMPSAPAGIGPFEFAAYLVYTRAHVSDEKAIAIALTFHMVQVIPVTLAGLAIVGREGLRRLTTAMLDSHKTEDSAKPL